MADWGVSKHMVLGQARGQPAPIADAGLGQRGGEQCAIAGSARLNLDHDQAAPREVIAMGQPLESAMQAGAHLPSPLGFGLARIMTNSALGMPSGYSA
jgi:hypothetical protein